MSTDAELLAEIILYIKSGARNTMASGLRQVLNDFVASKQNVNEKGIANGYAALDSGAKLSPTLLSITSPKFYQFLRDDGTFASPDALFRSSASGVEMLERYNFFEFFGTTATWVAPAKKNNRIYWVINRGSGTLTVNANTGGTDFQLISGGSATTSFIVSAGTCTVLVDDGDHLILIPQGSGGGGGTINGSISTTAGLLLSSTGTANELIQTDNLQYAGDTLNIGGVGGTPLLSLFSNGARHIQFYTGTSVNLGYIGAGNGMPFIVRNPSVVDIFNVDTNGVVAFKNQYSTSAAPTINTSSGAGSGAAISSLSGNNQTGTFTLTTGVTPSTNAVCFVVIPSGSFSAPNGFNMVVGAKDATTATILAATPNFSGGNTSVVNFNVSTVALPAATVLNLYYVITAF